MKALFILAVFFPVACQSSVSEPTAHPVPQVQQAKTERSITKVTTQAVNFDISTYGATSCEDFNKVFGDAPLKEITDKTVLASLSHRIELFKPDTAHFIMNARAKATILYNDNSTSTLCISRFVMDFNGNRIKYDKAINDLLRIDTKAKAYK